MLSAVWCSYPISKKCFASGGMLLLTVGSWVFLCLSHPCWWPPGLLSDNFKFWFSWFSMWHCDLFIYFKFLVFVRVGFHLLCVRLKKGFTVSPNSANSQPSFCLTLSSAGITDISHSHLAWGSFKKNGLILQWVFCNSSHDQHENMGLLSIFVCCAWVGGVPMCVFVADKWVSTVFLHNCR